MVIMCCLEKQPLNALVMNIFDSSFYLSFIFRYFSQIENYIGEYLKIKVTVTIIFVM